ncbi:MAG: nitroreductase family protein, partial [Pseudomonadota bacterium]
MAAPQSPGIGALQRAVRGFRAGRFFKFRLASASAGRASNPPDARSASIRRARAAESNSVNPRRNSAEALGRSACTASLIPSMSVMVGLHMDTTSRLRLRGAAGVPPADGRRQSPTPPHCDTSGHSATGWRPGRTHPESGSHALAAAARTAGVGSVRRPAGNAAAQPALGDTARMHAAALTPLLLGHRSIRQYKPDPVDPALVEAVLGEAIAGGSSSGNLNSVSVVLTREPARREALYELHSRQDMVRQAPLVITFCADFFRTRQWLALRGARDNFDNLVGWH